MKRVICYLFFLITFPACVNASSAYGFQFGLGVSATSGLNVMLGFHNPEHESFWLRHFGVRLDVATSDPLNSAINSVIDYYMKDGTDVGDGVKIDNGKLDAWHTMALIDYYPFGAWWRISGGYAIGSALLSSDVFGTIEQAPSNRFYFYLAGDHYYYNGNNFGDSVMNLPQGWERDGHPWIFSYDRGSIPSCTISENESRVFALFASDRDTASYVSSCSMEKLSDGSFRHMIYWPVTEAPVVYDDKLKFSERYDT